jgi:hypothetical protein
MTIHFPTNIFLVTKSKKSKKKYSIGFGEFYLKYDINHFSIFFLNNINNYSD